MSPIKRIDLKILGLLLGLALIPAVRVLSQQPRVVEVIADKDEHFKIPGQKKQVLTLKANELILLRITARKGREFDKVDNAVHSFSVKGWKDQGWDLRLKEGLNEFKLVVPDDPGEHLIECLVKCGPEHDDMNMKLIVTP